MPENNGNELPVEPEPDTEVPEEELVPLLSPGAREEEENELLEEWAAASDEEQIERLTYRRDWLPKLAIGGMALLAVFAVVFAAISTIGGDQENVPTADPQARNDVAALAKAKQRQARRVAAIRKREKIRQEKKRLAKQKARREARQVRMKATSEPEATAATETSSPLETSPPSPPPAPVPTPPPPATPAPVPQTPAPATAGQAADAFGPGP